MPSILLVDDDELLRELMELALSVEGYDVMVASNGAEGLDMLRKASCDLVVLDLMMPVMDGMRFMRILADEIASPPPVIVLSAAGEGQRSEEMLQFGAKAVVRKPVDTGELLERVRSVLDQSLHG